MKRFSPLLMGAGLMTGLLSFNNYVLAGPATTSNTYNRVDPAYQEVLKTSFIGQMVINNDQDLADYDAKLPHDFIGDYKPMTDTVPASDQDPAVELYVYRPQAKHSSEESKSLTGQSTDKSNNTNNTNHDTSSNSLSANTAPPALPILYYSHGGGYILRGALYNTNAYQAMADRFNMIVVTPKYRLTTEAPFPAALTDAYRGLQYTYANGQSWGGDTSRIVTIGDSAGGGLTATLNLYNKDHDKIPVRGEVLVYPMLDSRTGSSQDIYEAPNTGEYVWTRQANNYAWKKMGDYKKVPKAYQPYFSPVQDKPEALQGLPDTYMTVGDLDLFLNEDLTYANKLSQAGINLELNVVPGVYHNYYDMVPNAQKSQEFWKHVGDFIKRVTE